MEQLSFFENAGFNASPLPGLIDYIPQFIDLKEADVLLNNLIANTTWTQRSVLMYGKEVLTPRLTAWFGDDNIDYSIAGNKSKALPWTPELFDIKERVEAASNVKFNSVLLNYYRDGNDSVSWHDDRDNIPGRNRFVASVSLGAVRVFDIRSKTDHSVKYAIPLQSGSYLLMKGNFQEEWQHRIAKSANVKTPRVNLTFRISNNI